MNFISSLNLQIDSQCGFNPTTPILGFFLKLFLKKFLIKNNFSKIKFLLIFFDTNFIGKCVVTGLTDSFLL